MTPLAADDDRCSPAAPRVCRGEDVIECGSDGHLGRRLRACHDGCKDGRCELTCSDDGAQLIYVVDTANDFMSFDPRKLPGDPFHLIGKLQCHDRSSPFSMSVDRHGVAWVLFGDGQIFKVAIDDAKCTPSVVLALCRRLAHVRHGLRDRLARREDREALPRQQRQRARLLRARHGREPRRRASRRPDRRPARATPSSPAPATRTSTASIRSTTVRAVRSGDRSLDGRVGRAQMAARLRAARRYQRVRVRAVGGHLLRVCDDPLRGFQEDSTVRTVDRTGRYKTILQHLPYRISGAGVSTCAPEARLVPTNPRARLC